MKNKKRNAMRLNMLKDYSKFYYQKQLTKKNNNDI
jgi:hypothetical protein